MRDCVIGVRRGKMNEIVHSHIACEGWEAVSDGVALLDRLQGDVR